MGITRTSRTRGTTAKLAALLGAALISTTISTTTFAQTPAPGTAYTRSQNQQQRIAQGVGSGQLTGRETNHLEHREASIHSEKQSMRAADDGHLTSRDRRVLNRRQNRTSAAIARDKHNASVRQ